LSSVYDALQRARQGGQNATAIPEPVLREPERVPAPVAPRPIAAELNSLLAAVRPMFDHDGGVVLHIVAATPGEGASTIAREFALLAATSGQRHTLLVDADRRNPHTAREFGYDSDRGLVEAQWSVDNADVIHPVPGTLLSVTCLIGQRRPGLANASTVSEVYRRLRSRFELVVVDCPSVASGDYLELAPEAADGVILVVRAEATRPAVITHAKVQVERAGGNLLGAVLNRRTNYIPNFLYRML
jgi:protein-tyrosine kinase